MATMAAPHYFIPQTINGVQYAGASTGLSNPCEVILSEVRRLFPGRSVALTLSIGTGTRRPITAHNVRMGARQLAKGGGRVHHDMTVFHSTESIRWTKGQFTPGTYFRFDVPELVSKHSPWVNPWKGGKFCKTLLRLPLCVLKRITPGWGANMKRGVRLIKKETEWYLEQDDVRADLEHCADVLVMRYRKKVEGCAVKATV